MPNLTMLINNSTLSNIADAIRNKNGTNTTYLPSQMPEAIDAIIIGTPIQGVIEEYVIANNKNINLGDFVQFITENNQTKIQPIFDKTVIINGIAAESGTSGDTIDVYVPNTNS